MRYVSIALGTCVLLATHQASLEDVFIRLTGRSLRDG